MFPITSLKISEHTHDAVRRNGVPNGLIKYCNTLNTSNQTLNHIIFVSFWFYFLRFWLLFERMKIESIISGHRFPTVYVLCSSIVIDAYVVSIHFFVFDLEMKSKESSAKKINQIAHCETEANGQKGRKSRKREEREELNWFGSAFIDKTHQDN